MQFKASIRATLARVAELKQSGGVAAVEAAKAADAEFAEAVVRRQRWTALVAGFGCFRLTREWGVR